LTVSSTGVFGELGPMITLSDFQAEGALDLNAAVPRAM